MKDANMEAKKVEKSSLSLSDIFEIAFLMAKGQKYREMVPEKGRVRFIFDRSCNGILESFYADRESINPKLYMHAIKDVKSLVFNSKIR